MVRAVVAGIGPAALDRADLLLDVGAHHPSTHGSLRLALTVDDSDGNGIVLTAEPLVGHLHRGAEKLFEVRDYRQITMLANRHDWLSAFANEIGVVTAVERMLGIEVPERATWLRTLLVELNRMLAHLLFLAAIGPALDGGAMAARERLQSLLEAASGGRIHYGFSRVGGVREELPLGWVAEARLVLAGVVAPTVPGGLDGLGVLDRALVAPYGVSGPMARASGAALDLRVDRPYLAYDRLEVPMVTQTAGDVAARYAQLAAEVEASKALALQCLARLETLRGPVNVRLPKVVKAPEGAIYVRTENPLGVMGYYLVSHGEKTPWRLHLRTASFANVQVLRAVLPGTRVDDLATVLASVLFVVGDLDK